MRYAILGDIHANLEALTAVLAHADGQAVDAHYSLGDVVGYGVDPIACLERVRETCDAVVKGNHDDMAANNEELHGINVWAEASMLWTRRELTDEHRQWLDALPLTYNPNPDTLLVHGSPATPEAFRYLDMMVTAHEAFDALREQVCFVGHTHRPRYHVQNGERVATHMLESLDLKPSARYLINAGSVGQPRARAPPAAYVVYDTGTRHIDLHRVPYDIETAADKIRRAGLPDPLASRLTAGR